MIAGRSTIYDIASRARVSHTAVSLALRPPRGRPRLGPQTRARIRRTIEELNYRPNARAKGLRLGRTFNIGFYINRPEYLNLSEPGWHRVITAIQKRLWQHGYQLGFYFFETDHRKGIEEFLTPHRFVDGVIVQGRNLSQSEIAEFRRSGLQTVSLYEKIQGFASLEVDEFSAGRMAAEYLHQRGHRRVALLSQALPVERWEGRVRGFLARAAELGMETPLSVQFQCASRDSRMTNPRLGRELFEQFLKIGTDIRCLYVPSDYLSFSVVEAIEERGWVLGKDISLLSYDNLEGGGLRRWETPRLTSFDPPFSEIGMRAADLAMELTAPDRNAHWAIPPKLVERNSVATLGGIATDRAMLETPKKET